MSPRLDRHTCAACGRSRSREFHRKYPAGPGYPAIHSVCRRCRPGGLRRSRSHESLQSETQSSKDGLSRVLQALLRTVSNCGTRAIDGMADRQDVHVHVHHHHWHQDSEIPVRDPSMATSRSTLSRRNTLQSDMIELPGSARYFEMPCSPRYPPSASELPAYHVATQEQPPPVPPKPRYYDRKDYNYAS